MNHLILLNSFLSDVSSEKTRTTRISLLSGAQVVAIPIASLMSKFLLEHGGPLSVWCVTLSCYAVAIAWTAFLIKDSRGKGSNLELNTTKSEEKEHGASVLKNLYRSFAVTFKPRTGYKRACLAILLGMRCISIFSDDPFGMNYLYARKTLGWDAPEFALYKTALCSSLAFGMCIMI